MFTDAVIVLGVLLLLVLLEIRKQLQRVGDGMAMFIRMKEREREEGRG